MFHPFPTTHVQTFLSAHARNPRMPLRHSDAVHLLLREEESPLQRSLPPIFSALAALEKYPFLCALLATFPPHLHYAIKASLLASDPYQHLRLQVLEKLVCKSSPTSQVLEEADSIPLSFLLQHECVFGVIEGLLAEPVKYRRELAFLFTQLSVYRLPQHLQNMAASSVTQPLSVLPTYLGWSLCSAAEPRLSQAMLDHAVLFVNGALLLKFHGKLSGLAVQTTLLADGTLLIEGCWYAPIDQRNEIREAFDQGESRLCVQGQWTLLRPLRFDDTLLPKAQTYVSALPEHLPQQIANTTRQAYRHHLHEGF